MYHYSLLLKTAIVVLALYGVWILSAVPSAYIQFKTRPREPMEWCHKHGFFRRKHALPFLNTTICPRCYMEAWNDAGKVKK